MLLLQLEYWTENTDTEREGHDVQSVEPSEEYVPGRQGKQPEEVAKVPAVHMKQVVEPAAANHPVGHRIHALTPNIVFAKLPAGHDKQVQVLSTEY